MTDRYVSGQDGDLNVKAVKNVNVEGSLMTSLIKNHHENDTGDLPRVLRALSLAGEIKDIPVHGVMAIDKKGQNVSITEPTEAVLIGSANLRETYTFLRHFFRAKISPPEFKGEPEDDKDRIRKIWHEHKVECDEIIEEVENKISDLRSRFEQEAYRLDGGNLGENAEAFKRGQGSQYESYILGCEPIYTEAVQRLKAFASKVADMMA